MIGALLWVAAARASVPVELPLIDRPAFPSMGQSLAISDAYYEIAHDRLAAWWGPEHETAARWSIVGFDVLSTWVPLSTTWMHEEWHRAVMNVYGISSYDEVYGFPFFRSTIAVTHVSDDELVHLKAEHPADLARLSEAGMEAEAEQSLALAKDVFFRDSTAWVSPVLLFNAAGNLLYLFTCATKDADSLTDELNQVELRVEDRDFTGLDCTAWSYDLHRPAEGYVARGPHPSGVGLNRYRRFSDLSGDEQAYLRLQTGLSLLNFVNPFMWGSSGFRAGVWDWSFALEHVLTSFGFAVETNVFLRRDPWKLFGSLQNFFNGERWFPGIDGELLEYPVAERFHLSARLALWLQPADQLFTDVAARGGGLASVRLGWQAWPRVAPYAEVEGKSAGWVAGNPYLAPAWVLRAGLTASLF